MFARSSTKNLSKTAYAEPAEPMDTMSVTGKLANYIAQDRWIIFGALGVFTLSPAYSWSKLLIRGFAMSGFMFNSQLQCLGDFVGKSLQIA
jgi:hypothetical protein